MIVVSEELSDDHLLNEYVASRNQESFAVLVRRYGPMVWGVCRRTAGHTHDAEDAFQATFAVLARKASSIRRRHSIGPWLHQVARRFAWRARSTTSRGRPAADLNVSELAARPAADETLPDHYEILDDEIGRLPDSLRLPIVMCYLQGLTNREAGERLGCPEGTIVSRLARARDLLRTRLARRGIVLGGAAAVSTLLSSASSAASLAPELVQAAVRCGLLDATAGAATGTIVSAGAARLAEELFGSFARRLMLMRLGLLLGGIVTLALVLFGMHILAGNAGTPNGAAVGDGASISSSGVGEPDRNPRMSPVTTLEGIWAGEDLEFVGGSDPAEHERLSGQARWVISAGHVRFKWLDDPLLTAGFTADSSVQTGPIDFTIVEGPAEMLQAAVLGAFDLRDGKLQVCSGPAGGKRPDVIKSGVVAAPAADAVTIRAGLAGYAKLRRLNRSLEAEDLQGKWVLEQSEAGGAEQEVDPQGRQAVAFRDSRYTLYIVVNDEVVETGGVFSLDPQRPAQFLELLPLGQPSMKCLYEIEGDTLRLCMAAPGGPRPTEFKTTEGQNHFSMRLKRKPAAGLPASPDNSSPGNQPNPGNPDGSKRLDKTPP
jgi:RNA polymerase sigma factor (sigma-70 family)